MSFGYLAEFYCIDNQINKNKNKNILGELDDR